MYTKSSHGRFALGLMSGTSADGVDAALIWTDGEHIIEYVDGTELPYENKFRARLIALARRSSHTKRTDERQIAIIEAELTECHARAVAVLLDKNPQTRPDIIGFHGHTILHAPANAMTRQIGDAARLSRATGIPVVHDFRSADMLAGGQGAPLVPLFHAELFADAPKPVAILNLGGVANVTWLAGDGAVWAGDTGPGCGLLDAWIAERTNWQFDVDGKYASQGAIHNDHVEAVLKQPFFSLAFPKSADRFDFDGIDVSGLSIADGAATLCAVTAEAVWRASRQFTEKPQVLWVTGGGANHPVIMRLLADRFGDVRHVRDSGLRADSMEGRVFCLAGCATHEKSPDFNTHHDRL